MMPKYLLLGKWIACAIALAMNTLAAGSFNQSANMQFAIGCCAIAPIVSLLIYRSSERSQLLRLHLVLIECGLLGGALAYGVSAFVFPAFCLSFGQVGVLLKRIPAAAAGLVCLSMQMFIYAQKSVFSRLADHQSVTAAFAIMIGDIGNIAFMLIVLISLRLLLSEQSRRQLSEQLAVERDRARIARELHDSLGHTLTALKLQLDVANRLRATDETRSNEALEEATKLAMHSLSDMRVSVNAVNSDNFDFRAAVTSVIENAAKSGGLTVHSNLDFSMVPTDCTYQLYRVIQECVTNTVKHAQASTINIDSNAAEGWLTVQISDDGTGISDDASGSGFGQKNIRERIKMLGGEVRFSSNKDEGTALVVSIPLKARH